MLADCYSRDTPLLPAMHQPALLLSLAARSDISSDMLLRGTGLNALALSEGRAAVSPAQLMAILGNLAKQDGQRDMAFELGQQWLPGHCGTISLALLQAPNLAEALSLLMTHQDQLYPLLGPRILVEGKELLLYWTDSVGAGALMPFLVELHMTAVSALCRWLADKPLPWRYCFNRTPPRNLAQHQVHLGSHLQFGCQQDAMVLESQWLHQPWPRSNPAAYAMLQQQLLRQGRPQYSLVQVLYDHLRAQIGNHQTLEEAATLLATSPATLKRHLAKHGTHFQAVLDLARTHESLRLMQYHGYGQGELAQYFGFHDARNFRRSFKRWTGMAASLPFSAVGVA